MSLQSREDKARRLRASGRVHEPAFALTRIVEGDTDGPYIATVIWCATGGWTGRCDCKDGQKWIARGEHPELDKGQGCSHLRATRTEAIAVKAARDAPTSTRRRVLGLDRDGVFARTA